jgi:hypothetical protein
LDWALCSARKIDLWTELSEEQELFRRSLAKFVDKEVVPIAAQTFTLHAPDRAFHAL